MSHAGSQVVCVGSPKGGLAAILGGALFPLGFVATSIDGSDDPFLGTGAILAGIAALMFALIGLSSFQARRHPRLMWAALALPALGTAVACLGMVGMVIVGDRPFVAGRNPWEISMIGLFATAVGTAIFAVATYHTRALSGAAAGLLAAGSGSLGAVMVVGATGFWSITGAAATLLAVTGIGGLFAFSVGWIALGAHAVRLDRPSTQTRPT